MPLMCFSIVFDSVNTVVDSVAGEMLSHISTKHHASGSVARFSSDLVNVCLTHLCSTHDFVLNKQKTQKW